MLYVHFEFDIISQELHILKMYMISYLIDLYVKIVSLLYPYGIVLPFKWPNIAPFFHGNNFRNFCESY